MKKILTTTTTAVCILLASLITVPVAAQDNDDEQIKVRIETQQNGKKKVYEKTYANKKEMQQDKELQKLGFEDFDEGHFGDMAFSSSGDKQSKRVTINIDDEGDGEKIKLRKVIKDQNGEEQVIEREYNSREEMEADEEVDVEIIKEGEDYQWHSEDNDVHIKILKKDGKANKTKVSKTVIIEIDAEDSKGKKRIKKQIEVIENDDNNH